MCARPESVNHVISTSQKRPLSIIAEQDGDDPDATNATKCQKAADIRSRETILASNDILQLSKEINHDFAKYKYSESKMSHRTKKGQNKTFIKETKSKLIDTVPLASISRPEAYNNNSNEASPDSGNEASKCRSSLPSSCKENNIHNDNSSLEETHVTSSLDASTTQNKNSKQQLRDELGSSLKTVQTDEAMSSDNTRVTSQLSSSPSHEPPHDKEGVTEETDQTSSTSSPQSLTALIPELVDRLWVTTSSSRILHDIKDPTVHIAPEIIVTLPEGTHRFTTLPTSCIHSTDDIGNTTKKLSTDVIGNNSIKDVISNNSIKDVISTNIIKDVISNNSIKDVYSSNISVHPLTSRTCPFSKYKRAKLGAHLSLRTNSNDSTGALLGSELSDSNLSCSESQEDVSLVTHLSDFRKLKETTEKLHLSTRRPSIMLWRQQYLESQGLPGIRPGLNGDVTDERLTVERKERIDGALDWLRAELQEMRSQDQNLARQLLTIRHDIHQLKLKRSTEEHQELIEEFQSELDDLQEFSDVLDCPKTIYGNNPLKHIGVTRLNMNARRFSAC